MRIGRVSTAFLPSHDGMAHHVFGLSQEQVRRGHDVTLFQPHLPDGWESGIRLYNVSTWPCLHGTKRAYLLFCLRSAAMVWRAHRQENFHLLHAHGDFMEAFVLGSVGRFLGLPTVLTIHAGLNRRRSYTLLGRIGFHCVDRIIAVSPPIRDDLCSRFGLTPDRVQMISSGIHWRLLAQPDGEQRNDLRRTLGLPDEAILVITVGALDPMKGHQYLIDAARHLQSRDNLRFFFVGSGPHQAALCERAASDVRIRLVGQRGPAEVVHYLRCADMFVLPSVDLPGKREGTPTALMEAMAVGLPVIVTDSGGMPFLVENGTNGYIVPQRNARALASQIALLADHPELRWSMGERNRLKVKDRDWSVISKAVEDVYRLSLGPHDR